MAQMQRVGSHKTVVYTGDDGYTRIVYHKTPVVKFNHSEIILNSGGWETNTTKTRMNQASNQFGLGYTVFQKNWIWFVDYGGKVGKFHDGIVLKRGSR